MEHLIIFHAFVGLSLRQYGDDVGSDYSIDDALQTARDADFTRLQPSLSLKLVLNMNLNIICEMKIIRLWS